MTMMPARLGEIPSLTAFRGWLALWVVIYHYWNDVLCLFPATEALSPFVQVGHMAVPAFFILSGYVLAYNYADQFRTLRRAQMLRFVALRLARIYPVHLVTLLAVLAMVLFSRARGWPLTDAGYSARDFVLNLVLAQTWGPHFQLNWNYPSWSISSEWFAYLLFQLLTPYGFHQVRTRRQAAVILVGCFAASVCVLIYSVPFRWLLVVVPTFCAGMALHRLIGRAAPLASAWGGWLPLVLAAAVPLCCYLRPGWLVTLTLLCSFLAIIAALVLTRDRQSLLWTSAGAVYLGEVSYSLYMSHTLAQKVLYKLLPSARFDDATDWVKAGLLGVYAALVVAFCLGTYYLVEKPCREWFRKRLRAARTSPVVEASEEGAVNRDGSRDQQAEEAK